LLTNLLVAVARSYGIRCKKSQAFPVNAKQICNAFGKIGKTEEAEPFWHVYYGFFDRYRLWQKLLEDAIMHQMGWQYDTDVLKLRGTIKNCCFRAASDAINFLRRQVSGIGRRNAGIIITIKRTKEMITNENRYQVRPRGKFLPYMAREVSKDDEDDDEDEESAIIVEVTKKRKRSTEVTKPKKTKVVLIRPKKKGKASMKKIDKEEDEEDEEEEPFSLRDDDTTAGEKTESTLSDEEEEEAEEKTASTLSEEVEEEEVEVEVVEEEQEVATTQEMQLELFALRKREQELRERLKEEGKAVSDKLQQERIAETKKNWYDQPQKLQNEDQTLMRKKAGNKNKQKTLKVKNQLVLWTLSQTWSTHTKSTNQQVRQR